MNNSKLKGWGYVISLFLLILPLMFSNTVINSHNILSSSGQENQEFQFFEGFEEVVAPEILLADFDIEVNGEVPYGITSESVHSDVASFFVGPSTCSGFCFDDFSVRTTIHQ